jgi:hypothetical protein
MAPFRPQRLCNIRESLENERVFSIQEEISRGRKGLSPTPPHVNFMLHIYLHACIKPESRFALKVHNQINELNESMLHLRIF